MFANPPLPLPLRVQVQIDNGTCFEAGFEQDGIRRNEPGRFQATGTPATP